MYQTINVHSLDLLLPSRGRALCCHTMKESPDTRGSYFLVSGDFLFLFSFLPADPSRLLPFHCIQQIIQTIQPFLIYMDLFQQFPSVSREESELFPFPALCLPLEILLNGFLIASGVS